MDFMQALSGMGPAMADMQEQGASINANLDRIATALEGIRVLLADQINYPQSEDYGEPTESEL